VLDFHIISCRKVSVISICLKLHGSIVVVACFQIHSSVWLSAILCIMWKGLWLL